MQFSVPSILLKGGLGLLLIIGLGACGGDSSQTSPSSQGAQSQQQQARKIDSMFASLDQETQDRVDQNQGISSEDQDSGFETEPESEENENGTGETDPGWPQDTEEQQDTGWNDGGAKEASETGDEDPLGNTGQGNEGASEDPVDQTGNQTDPDGQTGQQQPESQQEVNDQADAETQGNTGQQEANGQEQGGDQNQADRQNPSESQNPSELQEREDQQDTDGQQAPPQQGANQDDAANQGDAADQDEAGDGQQGGNRGRRNERRTPLEQGNQAYERGQFDRAIKFYEEVDPPDADQQSDTYLRVLGRLGEMYWKEKGNYEEAVRAYESILDRDETRYQAHLNLAQLAFRLEDYDQMSTHLNNVDRLEYQIPKDRRRRVSLQSKYLRAIAKYQQTMNAETTRQKAQVGPRALQALSSFVASVPSEMKSDFRSRLEDAKKKRKEIKKLLSKLK